MKTHFTMIDELLGEISFEPLNLENHIQQVHTWTTAKHASFWGMQGYNQQQVFEFYKDLEQGKHTNTFIGSVADKPCFLVELYDPRLDQVGKHYDVQIGDKGMHILIAATEKPQSGFTYAVFKSVLHFMFQDSSVSRVIVEPDHSNHKIHRLNKRAGFQHIKRIQMGNKLANLAFCTKQQFYTTLSLQNEAQNMDIQQQPELATASINTSTWDKVNRLHIRKCLAELSHERILHPEQISQSGDWSGYTLSPEDGSIEYSFKAKRLALEHWLIDSNSIKKQIDSIEAKLDSVSFIIEFSSILQIPQKLLPTYLEEITSTLYSAAFKENKQWLSSEELLNADFQQVESAMSEGHPAFIANNGRIGFDAHDFVHYAPEAGKPISLIWLAGHKSRTEFSHSPEISYDSLLEQELDITTQEAFAAKISAKGQNPEEYTLIPVHPWQWFNKLANIYGPDIASNNLICLGYGDDSYQAQQSIRTFFNRSNPNKYYVKTALSVLNMGFMRGLSANYMRTTPAINDWVYSLIKEDGYLKNKEFHILREIAATGYRNPYYEHKTLKDNPYKKMLAALWRESPVKLLEADQRLMTMASLLHVDPSNTALLPTLINASGLSTKTWLERYLDAYLSPLLHCYYQHSLVFMPHGENLILIFENHVPVKAIMKDIGEEIYLLNSDTELPENVQRISIRVPAEEETLSFHTDVFDCFFRYMSAILVEHGDFPENKFWQLVANCIHQYQASNPHLQDRFVKHDLFSADFAHSCLNRLQLANNQQMVDLTDPAGSLKFAGKLKNPIAQFAQRAPNTNSVTSKQSAEV
ncbi:GNAT family N-acetyltransferase [Photobacterium kishitanii]|uniref:GNAT family N-acetyltransferase n=1 Tax=Photobacterium kishitanii TaxID=318456 RepID=A0AAX0YW99_9GAMM|nr:GNAT family N-acetyltransferase [Photobacterium kishitanii]PSX18242.1 GNAT family N-acetyltransferase [Photobacterium kishitanii]PSX26743.1 GNAT family N-acetyltransferase [Photobacterium kishitanii]PSX30815.1 GNAT family N-acetyltransferase [Photobacterium kishitanii]PSX44033.1 GNAT family N-acetyltransferase [Photobacterium kishitanii]